MRHPPGPQRPGAGRGARIRTGRPRGAGTTWRWPTRYLSFHGYALAAIERARQLGAAAGIPDETFAAPGIRLRNAVTLDHHGDSDGCLRVLRDIGDDLERFIATGGGERLRPSSLVAYGYAVARRAALGEPTDLAPETSAISLLRQGGDSARARDMRQLGEACLAIAADRPIEAMARLDTMTVARRDARCGRARPVAQHGVQPGR